MKKVVFISFILLSIFALSACGITDNNNENEKDNDDKVTEPEKDTKEENNEVEEEIVEEKEKVVFDFGDDFKRDNHFVAYTNQNNEFMLANEETGEEIKLADAVKKYQWHNGVLFYQTTDVVVSEYLSYDQIYKVDTNNEEPKPEVVVEIYENEEERYFKDAFSFDINDNGDVLLIERHGVLESEYWLKYIITDTTFGEGEEILPDLDQYETVLNEMYWEDGKLLLIVDKMVELPVYTYSKDEGMKLIHSDILNIIDFEPYEIFDAKLEDNTLFITTKDYETEELSEHTVDLSK